MRATLAIALLMSMSVCQAQEKAVIVGLIRDSTVAVQSGWGPAFAERFNGNAKIVNYAKNGATLTHYADAAEAFSKTQNLPFIDLHAAALPITTRSATRLA